MDHKTEIITRNASCTVDNVVVPDNPETAEAPAPKPTKIRETVTTITEGGAANVDAP